jgi:hypothetical protein
MNAGARVSIQQCEGFDVLACNLLTGNAKFGQLVMKAMFFINITTAT